MNLFKMIFPTQSLNSSDTKEFWIHQEKSEFSILNWAMFLGVFCFLLPGFRVWFSDSSKFIQWHSTLFRLAACFLMMVMVMVHKVTLRSFIKQVSIYTYVVIMNLTSVYLMWIEPSHSSDITPLFLAMIMAYGGIIRKPVNFVGFCSITIVFSSIGLLLSHPTLDFSIATFLNELVVFGLSLFIYLSTFYISIQLFKTQKTLQKKADCDFLTGTLNRSSWDKELQKWERTQHQRGGVLFVDVDHFKNINDTLGHDSGDKVLILLAEVIQKELREQDILARIGGEEFGVLIQADQRMEVVNIALRIRKIVENTQFDLPNIPKVTVSIGVAFRLLNEDTENWIRRADEAMYRAKNTGRNKVLLAKNYEKNNNLNLLFA